MSLSSPIIKINKIISKGKIENIIVFLGTNLEINNPEQLFNEFINIGDTDDPKYNPFKDIFSKDELTNISTNHIPVTFTSQSIHIDDNIGTIKLKVFEATGKRFSMDEIYLFCLKSEKLNPISLYQNLTQNDRIPLTKVRLDQMLYNIYGKDGKPIDFKLPIKDKYSFDDILRLNLLERDYLIAKALGQKFVFSSEYPFIVDPFYVTEYDHLLERSRKELSSLNNNLLLENEVIYDNTLYLCLADDVFKSMEPNKLSTEYASKIYYPFLYKANIDTVAKLETNRSALIKNTTDKLTKNTERIFENINMFYDVYKYKQPSNKFSQIVSKTGINSIKIVMYPDFKIKIPIDVIFKLLHASIDYPLIKFNPETRQENIYRLYTDKLTTDGRKIPFLNKSTVFKLIKQIGVKKSVAVYTKVFYQINDTYDTEKGENDYYMVCEFDENGNISVYPFQPFKNPVLLGNNKETRFEHINKIIELSVNQLIEQIKPFFEQSGLDIPLFKTIGGSNVEIRDIKYQTVYSITEIINLNKYNGCLSSIFSIESSDLTKDHNKGKDKDKDKDKGAYMRFKRVSNFTTLDSQVAFIIEKIDQGLKQYQIISELQQNYDDIDEEKANDVYQKTIRDLELTRGAHKRRSIMIKINPGFKTIMYMNSVTSELIITVSGINDLYYLNTFPIYIDTFVRITQDISKTRIDTSIINRLCSGGEIEELKFDEIIAQSEHSINDNQVPDIEDDSPIYSESVSINSNNDLLDMLGFEEDNLGSDTEFEGGKPGDDSDEDAEEPPIEANELPFEIDLPNKPKLKQKRKPIAAQNNIQTKIPNKAPADNKVHDITGMKLKYPNPFSKRIEDKIPKLFVKSKDDKIDLYTRMCPFSLQARRQPIILTKAEKDDLVNEHPDEYLDEKGAVSEKEFIEYSANPKDPSKKYYFTCPRYWCLKTNTMVTEKDILAGKCGPKVDKVEDAIIPRKAEVVPKDRFVYQFYDKDAPDNYPGFHKENLSDGTCIPCCYSKWSTTEMKKRRDVCQGKINKPPITESKHVPASVTEAKLGITETKQPSVAEAKLGITDANTNIEDEFERSIKDIEGYVKGPEKYPLPKHRWGFLPISVQKFLHEVNSDCQISKTNMNLKPNHTCLLRHGVEKSPKQSFIACIAMTMFYGQSYLVPDPDKPGKNKNIPLIKKFLPKATTDVPTIQEMKKIIIDAIDIDKFITYQNGDLIASFANPMDMEKQVAVENIRHINSNLDEEEYPNKFVKGEKIECNYRGLNKWYHGKILNVNRNDTYDITYDKTKVNIHDYKDSELYKKIHNLERHKSKIHRLNPSIEADEEEEEKTDEEEKKEEHNINEDFEFLEKVIESFENFRRFLTDNNIYIDYTYLWDIICVSNPKLFENGLNLVVLEISEEDVSNNIELACPTNQYSNHIYDVRKRSLFLVKRDKWFEPIYAFHNRTDNKPNITSTFTEYDRELPSTMRSVFSKIIKPTLGERCKPLLSQPAEYRFKQAPLLDDLIKKLLLRKYKIIDQVMNFQGKVIGVTAISPKHKEGFIPCYPSSLTLLKQPNKKQSYGYIFMTDDIWKSYDHTLSFLKDYYKYEEPKDINVAQCFDSRYFCKVADNEMKGTLVVGFLTNTNQFIQIKEPKAVSEITDNIKTITGNDTLVADINILTSSRVDNRRVDFIKRIQLETNFYNVFRNTIRILFNDYSNSDKRKEIQAECNKKTSLYKSKLTKVTQLLQSLVNNSIEFAEPFDYKNINENDLQSCITNKATNCNENSTSICKISKINGKCIISLPLNNLVTKTSNHVYYFGRMADELIRYNRIKSFIFKPQAYLSFGQVKYNLRDNEIIILEDMLTQDFFDNLIPSDINIYAKNNTYDNTEPIISHRYNSEITMDEVINPTVIRQCPVSEPKQIKSLHWRKCFPSGFKEIVYGGSRFCAFYLIIDLVKKIKNMDISIEIIKNDLIDEYNRLTQIEDKINIDRKHKILDFLKEEAQHDVKQILEGAMTFEQMIIHDGFNIVSFDIWILLNKYEIPSCFISINELHETNSKRNEFVCYKSNEAETNESYVFIIVPAMYSRKSKVYPEYKLVVDALGNELINIGELIETENRCLTNIRNAIDQYYTIEDFLDNKFEKKIYKKNIKNKEPEEEEEEPEEESDKLTAMELKNTRDIIKMNPDILNIKKGGSKKHTKKFRQYKVASITKKYRSKN